MPRPGWNWHATERQLSQATRKACRPTTCATWQKSFCARGDLWPSAARALRTARGTAWLARPSARLAAVLPISNQARGVPALNILLKRLLAARSSLVANGFLAHAMAMASQQSRPRREQSLLLPAAQGPRAEAWRRSDLNWWLRGAGPASPTIDYFRRNEPEVGAQGAWAVAAFQGARPRPRPRRLRWMARRWPPGQAPLTITIETGRLFDLLSAALDHRGCRCTPATAMAEKDPDGLEGLGFFCYCSARA